MYITTTSNKYCLLHAITYIIIIYLHSNTLATIIWIFPIITCLESHLRSSLIDAVADVLTVWVELKLTNLTVIISLSLLPAADPPRCLNCALDSPSRSPLTLSSTTSSSCLPPRSRGPVSTCNTHCHSDTHTTLLVSLPSCVRFLSVGFLHNDMITMKTTDSTRNAANSTTSSPIPGTSDDIVHTQTRTWPVVGVDQFFYSTVATNGPGCRGPACWLSSMQTAQRRGRVLSSTIFSPSRPRWWHSIQFSVPNSIKLATGKFTCMCTVQFFNNSIDNIYSKPFALGG